MRGLHQLEEPQGVVQQTLQTPAVFDTPNLVAEWIMTLVAVGLSMARRVSDDHGQLLICFPWEVRGSEESTSRSRVPTMLPAVKLPWSRGLMLHWICQQ